MNKYSGVLLFVIGGVLLVFFAASFTGILKVYKNPTLANEPILKQNSFIIISNMVEPQRGSFVCYKYKDEMLGNHRRIHRLCAIEGDTLEIRKGVLYVNNKNFDKNLNLIHFYKFTKDDKILLKIKNQSLVNFVKSDTSIVVSLEYNIAKQYDLLSKRIIETVDNIDSVVKRTFYNDWNKDNLGPIIIPKNSFFVIGDYRDNSEDSRYIGMINQDKIIGVVINH